MSTFVWLAIAVAAGAAAYYFSATALGKYRMRRGVDENEERYRAWRGRAARPTAPPVRGMTADERRDVVVGLVLLVVSLAALLAFFATSS